MKMGEPMVETIPQFKATNPADDVIYEVKPERFDN
jgi:hypothetical protein